MTLRLKGEMSRFIDDTFGGITAFTAAIFLGMVLSVGMAVDFMRHETYRAELQDAVDRGVLAAAAFKQSVDPYETVKGYIKSTRFVKGDYQLNVVPTITAASRTIAATASYDVDTFFLKLIGIPSLEVKAMGTAIEGATEVEVSMVLDISTSMVWDDDNDAPSDRLATLQSSAKEFIDRMYSGVNEDRLTLSLIPFAGQVNVGSTAFGYLNSSRVHNYSHCIEFSSSDFVYVDRFDNPAPYQGAHPSSTVSLLPPPASRSQMQHFNFSKYDDGNGGSTYGPPVSNVDWGWCPSDAQAIEYFSNDPDQLKARIDGLRTHEATGSAYGMKWAAMLLDPSANGLAQVLVNAGEVKSQFNNLPRPYDLRDEKGVQKFIIMLSDGETTGQVRLKANKYRNQTDYDHYATNLSGNQNADFRHVDPAGSKVSNKGRSKNEAIDAFLETCETAKDNEVIIFTIGFETGSDAEDDLRACATDPSNFYAVDGPELAKAFADIAATIQKLKLIN